MFHGYQHDLQNIVEIQILFCLQVLSFGSIGKGAGRWIQFDRLIEEKEAKHNYYSNFNSLMFKQKISKGGFARIITKIKQTKNRRENHMVGIAIDALCRFVQHK